MYLKQTMQKNGRTRLSIVQGFRLEGKAKTRTVESLGFLDELEKEYEDPIGHFKAECARRNARAARSRGPVSVNIFPSQKIDRRSFNRKNIGCAIALSYYNDLNIERTLRNQARGKQHDYDENAILRLLVVESLLFGGSGIFDPIKKDRYFFRSDFSQNDLLDALDFFGREKLGRSVVAAMNREIAKTHTRDTGRAFFNITDYCFESPHAAGLLGPSPGKERPSPIVQMGLLQDASGIPLGFRLFPGNTSCQAMIPAVKEMKRELGLEHVVVVADKELNTSANIDANLTEGNGFFFSQSIRGRRSSDELRKWVLSEEGYQENVQGSFKIKSRKYKKLVRLEDRHGRKTEEEVPVKVVAFWTQAYANRARLARAKVVEKARELALDPSSYDPAAHYGATRYLDNAVFDKRSGDIVERS
ncbi:MAG: hypothetical protein FWE65_00610, partial [Eggerthellaceae bacterium]|nr:hypothetical protein [Eggerthellaceae bacterium]